MVRPTRQSENARRDATPARCFLGPLCRSAVVLPCCPTAAAAVVMAAKALASVALSCCEFAASDARSVAAVAAYQAAWAAPALRRALSLSLWPVAAHSHAVPKT